MPASTRWEFEVQVTAAHPLVLRVADIRRETPRAALVSIDLGGASFRFKAGQSVDVGLEGRDLRKPYSIACPPQRVRESGRLELLVSQDARGRFGGHLAGLKRGSRVEVAGPSGRFVLPPGASAHPLIFIAGGVGIAPFRAMIEFLLAEEDRPDITLVYSARTPDEFAFAGEFRRLARQGRVRLRQTVTRGAGPSWNGRRGRVRPELLAELIDTPGVTSCFVCGPDPLVAEVPVMLHDLGVALSRIHYERF